MKNYVLCPDCGEEFPKHRKNCPIMVLERVVQKNPPPPSLQDTKEKPDKGDFTQGRWLKSLKLTARQEHYIIATVKDIVNSAIHKTEKRMIGEAIAIVEYDEKHAPKSPKDITVNQQGGWYLGRIDGLQSVENKLKQLLTHSSQKK